MGREGSASPKVERKVRERPANLISDDLKCKMKRFPDFYCQIAPFPRWILVKAKGKDSGKSQGEKPQSRHMVSWHFSGFHVVFNCGWCEHVKYVNV